MNQGRNLVALILQDIEEKVPNDFADAENDDGGNKKSFHNSISLFWFMDVGISSP